jgi:AraC-like DNA-binding protein
MEITFDFITFIHLAAVVVGFITSAVILYFGFRTNPANQPLGIGQLSISLAVFVSFSLVSQLIVHWPFLYRLGNVFVLIFIPMPYLYAVFYTKNRQWRWYDLLHVLPLLIYLVDYWDVLWMSSAQKLIIIQQEINNLDTLGKFGQSKFFGPGFHQEFRTVLFSAYWVAQVVILAKWLRSQTSLTRQSKVWRNWMLLFIGCQFFIWFPFYLSLFGLSIMKTYHIVNSFSILWILLSSLALFFFPSLLYGKSMEGSIDTGKETKVPKKVPITNEEEQKLEEFMRRIESEMDGNKYFLVHGYSINDFSKDTEIPVYQISKSINHYRGMGFIDFINQKRIQYCIKKIDSGEWSTYKVSAIASECGFNSRNSFTIAFKKIQGTLPSDYRQTKMSDESSQ